eukprot:TRINITY_DN880_c0_g1_i3.p1 TRINITY_DN880_c0_g1~~TRINITY_DN880_c0_g1_i3.p1  ORF type:complete len:475 (+),score=87.12 TRINITY_DN880_c0_g1_i3:2214-3638(+)
MQQHRKHATGPQIPLDDGTLLLPRARRKFLAVLPLVPAIWVAWPHLVHDPVSRSSLFQQLVASLCLAVLGFVGTVALIPRFVPYLAKRGLVGKDLCKKGMAGGDVIIPEAAGVIPGTVFLVCIIFLQLTFRSDKDKMVDFHSALLSVCFMVLLGFADDVLDLPWRTKLFLPTIATLPLLCAYRGSTSVLVPPLLTPLLYHSTGGGTMAEEATALGGVLEALFDVRLPNGSGAVLVNLGVLYMLYMGLLAVFCTNAINIYAGINGLEAGQCLIIACAILTHNLVELAGHRTAVLTNDVVEPAEQWTVGNHVFSAQLMMPFVGTTLGLLWYNWYPSLVFVGDTYCYFAGMTFAVAGIHGHFSKTLVLMFIPQWINFFLSVPQLFKLVPCPRHRLPRVDPATGLLHPSTVECKWLSNSCLATGEEGHVMNLTLINMVLHVCGPMQEEVLCTVLLVLQVVGCVCGFVVRYHFASLVYK